MSHFWPFLVIYYNYKLYIFVILRSILSKLLHKTNILQLFHLLKVYSQNGFHLVLLFINKQLMPLTSADSFSPEGKKELLQLRNVRIKKNRFYSVKNLIKRKKTFCRNELEYLQTIQINIFNYRLTRKLLQPTLLKFCYFEAHQVILWQTSF